MTADPIPFADQVEAAKREYKMRARVYPRRVFAGQMTQDQAERELARMEAIVRTLEHVAAIMADATEAGARDLEVKFFGSTIDGNRVEDLQDSASASLDELFIRPADTGRLL